MNAFLQICPAISACSPRVLEFSLLEVKVVGPARDEGGSFHTSHCARAEFPPFYPSIFTRLTVRSIGCGQILLRRGSLNDDIHINLGLRLWLRALPVFVHPTDASVQQQQEPLMQRLSAWLGKKCHARICLPHCTAAC